MRALASLSCVCTVSSHMLLHDSTGVVCIVKRNNLLTVLQSTCHSEQCWGRKRAKGPLPFQTEKKGKENTTPFNVSVTRSLVTYQAAQFLVKDSIAHHKVDAPLHHLLFVGLHVRDTIHHEPPYPV